MGIPTLIVDHDSTSRRSLVDLLRREPEVDLLGECGDAPAAIEALCRLSPHLVFLDAQLPGHDSFQIAVSCTGRPTQVVFLAEHDGEARRAFDVRALDYLVKPVEAQRLRRTLSRAREQLTWLQGARRDRILVKVDGRVLLLHRDEIDRVESAGNYLKLHLAGATHMVRHTMADMEKLLGSDRFVRVHRSHLVNIDRIAELCPLLDGDYTVVLRGGTRVTMSRSYRERVQQRLGRNL
jgi:two-component system LytT family response regulator